MLESQFLARSVCQNTVHSTRNVVDQRSGDDKINWRSCNVPVNWKKVLSWFWHARCEDCVSAEKDHLQYLSQSWEVKKISYHFQATAAYDAAQSLLTVRRRSRFRYKMSYLTRMSWEISAKWSCRVPITFKLCWLCTIKNLIEIKYRRTIKDWRRW